MQPGDADVDHQLRLPTEIPGGEPGLAGYRQVRRAGAGHHDQPAGRLRAARPARPAAGLRVVERVGQDAEDGGGVFAVGAGEQT